jgi:hypothetical protein
MPQPSARSSGATFVSRNIASSCSSALPPPASLGCGKTKIRLHYLGDCKKVRRRDSGNATSPSFCQFRYRVLSVGYIRVSKRPPLTEGSVTRAHCGAAIARALCATFGIRSLGIVDQRGRDEAAGVHRAFFAELERLGFTEGINLEIADRRLYRACRVYYPPQPRRDLRRAAPTSADLPTIPIVAVTSDPIVAGLASSLARLGGT